MNTGGLGPRRKKDMNNLGNLVKTSNQNDEDFDSGAKKVIFENDDAPVTLNTIGVKYYTNKSCDYDPQLIGSPEYWHQVIVSDIVLY